jgi:SPP1 family predicted phage head-tail adaptor
MRAGLLRFPIVILEKSETKDSYGATSDNWGVFADTKANVVNVNGQKKISDDQFTHSNATEFTIRHNIKVNEKMRIQYDGKLYKILYINKFILNNNQIIGTEFLERA